MGFLPIGVCVISLVSLFLLIRSLSQLRPIRSEIVSLLGTVRLRSVFIALLAGPLLVIGALVLIFLFILKDQLLLRTSHAMLVLGLWMVVSMALLSMIVITRLGQRPDLTTLAAAVLSVPLVAYLTPLEQFAEVFPIEYIYIPLITGLIIISTCYLLIFIIRNEILASTSTDSSH